MRLHFFISAVKENSKVDYWEIKVWEVLAQGKYYASRVSNRHPVILVAFSIFIMFQDKP